MSRFHIALLRGINVGGKNKLPMKRLAELFEEAGCSEVRTYIQSGNVVFQADSRLAAQVPERIVALIERDFDFRVPVITRTRERLQEILDSNPFLGTDADEKELHIAFLSEMPDPDRIHSLDPERSPPDEFRVRGSEIYLRYPNGLGRSKLTNAYFDSKLGVVSTFRNLRTSRRLLELC